MPSFRSLPARLLATVGAAFLAASAPAAQLDILAGDYDGTFDRVHSVNEIAGAYPFYNAGYFGQNVVIANVEAGHVWGGHEVFDRTGLDLSATPAVTINADRDPVTAPDLGDLDFHATMVGHVLAGTGLLDNGDLSLLGAGIAPLATLWSGAIATRFDRTEENLGSFEISPESFRTPYRAFFRGVDGRKADVINSSWGFDDPAATSEENRYLDALAAENPTVTFVRSAGNGGAAATPGVGYNGITVGALGGAGDADPFLQPSTFSSRAPGDYHDPVTQTTLVGVRASVDLAAPGEQMALAYYGGKSGSLADLVGEGNPATDLYYTFNQAGTSFSAPTVAGGVALLKDVARGGVYLVGQDEALDSRVVKSVLQAGARETVGWNNGQQLVAGVVRTSQALDYATGAGRMDLETSVEIYVFGTTDVPGLGGGGIATLGWDYGQVTADGAVDYRFDLSFSGDSQLTVSLNWFVQTGLDGDLPTYGSFADLNLSVWRLSGSVFESLVASSETRYGNSEFLRVVLSGGDYGLRVTHEGMLYDFTGAAAAETFGLAWSVTAVPEPAAVAILIGLLLAGIVAKRRFAKSRKLVNPAAP